VATSGTRILFGRKLALIACAGIVTCLAACSGDSTAAEEGPGTDEEYVADLCKASSRFATNFLMAAWDPDNQASAEAQIDATVAVLEKFSGDLARARPPADLVAFHAEMVSRTRVMIDEIERRDTLKPMDGPGPIWPPGALERLEPIADEHGACKISALPFG
jgi:hypothetical protein